MIEPPSSSPRTFAEWRQESVCPTKKVWALLAAAGWLVASAAGGETRVTSISSSRLEGASGQSLLTFTLQRSPVESKELRIPYAFVSGGTATPGTDFTVPAPGEFVFLPDAATATATVSVHGDSEVEPNETVWLRLMPPQGVQVREKWRVTTPPEWAAGMLPGSSVGAQALSGTLAAWQERIDETGEFRLVAWWRGLESGHQWRRTRSLPPNSQPGPIPWFGSMAADGNSLMLALGEGSGLRLVIFRYDPSIDDWAEEASVPVPMLPGYDPMVFNLHLHGGTAVATILHRGEMTAPVHVIHLVRRQQDGTWLADPALTSSTPLFQPIVDVLDSEETMIVRSFENGTAALARHRLFQRSGPPAAPWIEQWDLAPAGWTPAPQAAALGRHNGEVTLHGTIPQNSTLWEYGRWAGSGPPPLTWTQTASLKGVGEVRAGLDEGAPIYLTGQGPVRLITHPLAPDGSYESAEVIELPGTYPGLLTVRNGSLLASTGFPLTPALAERLLVEGVIANDDGRLLSALDAVATEPESGSSEARIEVQASQRLGSPVTINWQSDPDTAQSPADFSPASGTLTIPAGGISGFIDIRIEADQMYEGQESFRVRLVSASAGMIDRPEATVVIQDQDVPHLSSDSPAVEIEGDMGPQPWAASVSLPAAPAVDTTVAVRTGGTARRGIDYTLPAATLFWPAGQRTVPIPWQGLGDVLTEEEETVTLSSWRPDLPVPATANWAHAGSALEEPNPITGFSLDDDQLVVTVDYPAENRLKFYRRHPVEGWQLTHSSVIPAGGSVHRLALRDRQCLVGIAGQALLWHRSDAGWEYQRILTAGAVDNSLSAPAVAISDAVAAMADGELMDGKGLYIHYRHFGGREAWGRVMRIDMETANPGAQQIDDMAIEGDWLVLGRSAYEYVSGGNYLRGAVEVRHRNQGGPDRWGVATRILSPNRDPFDWFGRQVSLSGRTLAIRLGSTDTPAYGIAIYERSGEGMGTWNHVTSLPAPWDMLSPFALEGDWLAVVDATEKPWQEQALRGRELVIRHRHAGREGAWGVAHAGLASNRSVGGLAIDGPNLMLSHRAALDGSAPIDAWEASEQAVLRIKDDDPAPVIMTLANASTTERSTTLGFKGLAQTAVDEDVFIDFEIVPITAQPGSDLDPNLRGIAFLGAHNTEFHAWVTVLDDTIPEPDETFLVRLTGISKGKIVAQAATGTVIDNDVDTRNARILLPFDNPVRAHVPTAATYALPWREPDFDDSGWLSGFQGVGYENEPASANSYMPHLGLDLRAELFNVNPSVLLRLPFTLPDPLPSSGRWLLRHRVDDGMVLWINGQEIMRVRGNRNLAWNTVASDSSPEDPGLPPTNTLVPTVREYLRSGPNLAAVQGMNAAANSSDLLVQLELSHFSILASPYLDAVTATRLATLSNYWPSDDADKDGFTNGHEFAAGTNPGDAASQPAKPPLQVARRDDGVWVLEDSFGLLPPQARIEVESSTSLSQSAWSTLAMRDSNRPWQVVPPVTMDENGRLLVPTSPAESHQYFRCVIRIDTQ